MNRLRELRKSKGLSLRDLAKIVNMSYSNIASIERGEVLLKEDTAKIFASYFNVTLDYLLGNTDNPNAIRVRVFDNDGTITELEHELLNKMQGCTIQDLQDIDRYIDFIKSKKGNESKWEIDF